MNALLKQAVEDAGQHFGTVIQMLIDGVAFRQDGLTYEVYSHDGDELGTMSTADLNHAIHFMKKRGRAVGKCTSVTKYLNEPAFTFGWEGWIFGSNGTYL